MLIAVELHAAGVTTVTPTISSTDATSYGSNAFTPAANDLLIVYVMASATLVASAPGAMTDSQGLGFTRVISANNSNPRSIYIFVANALAANSSMTVTFDCTGDTAGGAIIIPVRIAGMSRTGSSAILQSKVANNSTGTTPEVIFDASAATGNVTFGGVANATNPAGVNEPTNWTEDAGQDVGYTLPTSGAEFVYRNSGFTGTTITWGSTSASVWIAGIIELDTSAAPSGDNTGAFFIFF